MSFRPVFGKPRLIHDWGEEQHERETHWTSLFYDLLIVAALNAIAEPFEEVEWDDGEEGGGGAGGVEEDGGDESMTQMMRVHLLPIKGLWLNALLQFASVVIPWNALNEMTAKFEDESFVGHLAFFVHCFGLASTTAGCVGTLHDNYKTLAVGIIITKIGLLILYARPLYYIPRARQYVTLRCGAFTVGIVLMLIGLTFTGPDAFERFRVVLIVATVWDLLSLLLNMGLRREERLPIHIQSYSDRIKEVTMVIFGEAILAVTLRAKSSAGPNTRFYASLASTLWLIYSLALQENHIHPSVEDHALRRSSTFGFLWFYTQFFKQTALLGASLGIKRAHLLTFVAPEEPIDQGTYRLLVWGLSLTLLAVVLIRSYSFGFGRHPSKDDPPPLWRIKVAWWTALSVSCFVPQLIGLLVMRYRPQPLSFLVSMGLTMFAIILFETYASNKTAELIMGFHNVGDNNERVHNELTYLASFRSAHQPDEECFLKVHTPKTEQDVE